MTDWGRGGWTGSLNSYVRREVNEHIRDNPAVKQARYSWGIRFLQWAFAKRSFAEFVVIYVVLALMTVVAELVAARYLPCILPLWAASGPPNPDIKSLLNTIAGYLITAQVGVLGVISIAVGLVTLIAQREGAGTDIKVYYHASLAFEVVASCIALLVVLCGQLLWPMQFTLHRLGEGTNLQIFKLFLVGLHTAWLALNLSALAHFVATTFRFVQQSARERLREEYIANVVLRADLTRRLRHEVYLGAGPEIADVGPAGASTAASVGVHFGLSYGEPELHQTFGRPALLNNFHMTFARWALKIWSHRCQTALKDSKRSSVAGLAGDKPTLFFPIHLDVPVSGMIVWCRRRGGLPLNIPEKLLLKLAFRFGGAPRGR